MYHLWVLYSPKVEYLIEIAGSLIDSALKEIRLCGTFKFCVSVEKVLYVSSFLYSYTGFQQGSLWSVQLFNDDIIQLRI